MVNLIWAFMAIVGIVYAMFNGTMDEVNKALFKSANDAVTLSIGLISILVFWLGIMKIAETAGILKALSKALMPIVSRLFPEIPKGHPAMGYILSNITANIFGLGNAATPMGLKAMEQMKQLSGTDTASRSMITFLALNTSGLTLIPTTVIAIRMQYHSVSPTEIVGTTIITTVISLISAILLDRLFYYQSVRRKK
ncbi:nucleoside recognition domain-containing protein [Oceanobacillus chungangensis]|uniref:Spore maturation protein n=1 Tax=Oceanobacillus chungangensis TaxID=1229152 RepID=A0A3D8Q2U6_9BACI|nr:nucleoside recognition domain-containing protein [Oceanobacillus chungangensis]RDW22011.1 spore maturation protein [Oceanobacillus chungangensis]